MGIQKRYGNCMLSYQDLFNEKLAPSSAKIQEPNVDELIKDPEIRNLIYGAKGVGSHGGGSIQFLARDSKTQQELYELLTARGLTPYLFDIEE